jgi:hypothetical protein
MKTFDERIGQTIHLVIPMFHSTEFQHVKLHGVEIGGMWIESEKATQVLLSATKLPAGKTPVFFLPYSQIRFGVDVLDGISLSEKAFGV